jgi:predicted nucleotidyltransferase
MTREAPKLSVPAGGAYGNGTVPDIPELVPLRQILSDLLAWLTETRVPGIIIGGVAASLLGRPRLTRDVDVLVMLDAEKWEAFLTQGRKFGFVARGEDALAFARKHRVLLVRHVPSHLDADLSFAALPFEEEAIARPVRMDLGGLRLPLPTPEDLLIMKAVAHRPRDLLDVEAILEAHPRLDRRRVRSWVKQFAEALEAPEILAGLNDIFRRATTSRRVKKRNPSDRPGGGTGTKDK